MAADLEANTEAIVRLAWARHLGLPDEALAPLPGRRLYHQVDDASAVMFVRLFGQSVFLGPDWALERARAIPQDDDLQPVRALLQLCADHGGRALGAATLAYADDYVAVPEDLGGLVSGEAASVAALERACPPDDVAEVGLDAMDSTFVLVEEDDPAVALAGAGYAVWDGILGHLGVLTALAHRRQGHGTGIAAVATNDALDSGLVPQWRARVDNGPSRRVGARLGFTEVGSQTTVVLGS